MMAHNLSGHAISSALNHRSSPYQSQDHQKSNRNIPILSVPEILDAFQQSHPSTSIANTNFCPSSVLRSAGSSDPWELPELKWLDPADNNVLGAPGENLTDAEKYADHSLSNLGPDKFILDGGPGERWPFSSLYAGDRVGAANCTSAIDDGFGQFSALQSMAPVSVNAPQLVDEGRSLFPPIKSIRGVSCLNTTTSSSNASRGFPVPTSSSGPQTSEWRRNSTSSSTAAAASASQKRPYPSERVAPDFKRERYASDRSSHRVGTDNCLPERLVSNYEVSALTVAAASCPPERKRRFQAGGKSTPSGEPVSSAGPGPDQAAEKGPVNDQAVSPGRDSTKKSAASGAANASDHEIHIWTERERRKKMNGMFSTLHKFLPHLASKADKSTIVDEAINYIQSLEQTLKGLLKQKCEAPSSTTSSSLAMIPSSLAVLQSSTQTRGGSSVTVATSGSGASASTTEIEKIPPAAAATAAACDATTDVKPSSSGPRHRSSGSTPTLTMPLGESHMFRTLCSPNIVLNVCGTDAFITICSPRGKPGLLCRVLLVVETHGLHVLNAHISTTDDTILYMFHTQGADPNQLSKPDTLDLALKDLTNCLTTSTSPPQL